MPLPRRTSLCGSTAPSPAVRPHRRRGFPCRRSRWRGSSPSRRRCHLPWPDQPARLPRRRRGHAWEKSRRTVSMWQPLRRVCRSRPGPHRVHRAPPRAAATSRARGGTAARWRSPRFACPPARATRPGRRERRATAVAPDSSPEIPGGCGLRRQKPPAMASPGRHRRHCGRVPSGPAPPWRHRPCSRSPAGTFQRPSPAGRS